ncbi:hemolysin-III channel protein Izh2 [Tothia fuscella]|uniref:Hemolysin-III channel protein Izh2 n=1 Tax=Tothia fuscella TaxID=1048955 RepID=A0A9P4NU63_9PEZI|nr:hemolysin-III channel protein Izh2 [Tothia fuscella]
MSLLAYHEIPEWYQDNDCVLHGYRPVSNSARACIISWGFLHNETVNIFSHLLPGLFFLAAEGLIYPYFGAHSPNATIGVTSSSYHTLMNHSMHVSNLWLRLDSVGIFFLTLGDFVSGIYMVFYCAPILQRVCWTMILTLGIGTIIILLKPKFQGRRWRTFRVCTFVGTGPSGLAPLAHGIKKFGFSQMLKQSGMPYCIGEGLLPVLGAIFYTSLKPGKFDIIGCSHQKIHLLVVLATSVQLIGIVSAFEYNYHYRTCRQVGTPAPS